MIERLLMLPVLVVVLAIPPLRQALFPQHDGLPQSTKSTRYRFGDMLKGIAILGVIVIHVSHIFVLAYGDAGNAVFVHTVNNLLRFSLPFFFILSGIFLFLPSYRAKDVGRFYWRKIVRIFIPFALCTAVIAAVAGLSLREFGALLVSGEALVPYYFIIILFQLYIVYPLLLPLRRSRAALIVIFLLSFASYLFLPNDIGIVPFAGRFIFFFFYGMYIRESFLANKKTDIQSWVAIALLYVFVTMTAFFIDTQQTFFFNARFFFGLAMFHILWAARAIIEKEAWIARILEAFGRNSLWIYLIHFLVVAYLFRLGATIGIPYYTLFVSLAIMSPPISYALARVTDVAYTRILSIFYAPKKK